MRKLATWLMIFLTAQASFAATRTASVSGNWHDTATWGGSSVPTSSDDAQINDSITVTCEAGLSCTSKTLICTNTGGSCVFNIGIGGTYTYHGNVAMGTADWTFSHGAVVKHDDDGTTSNHFTWLMNYTGKLVLNGTTGDHITWGIAAASGYAGTIGNGAGSTANGQLHGTYVDFADISSALSTIFWLANMNGSGAEWTCDSCTFTRTGDFYFPNWAGDVNFALTHSTYQSGYANANHQVFFFTGVGAKTGGTRSIIGNYWDTGALAIYADVDGRDIGMKVQDNFCAVNDVSPIKCVEPGNPPPSFSSDNWKNNVFWVNNPSNASTQATIVFYGGISTRTYVLNSSYVGPTCAVDYGLTNYHPSDVSPVDSTLDGIILESDCSDDGPSADLIENHSLSVVAPLEVKNSMSLPAPPHDSNGAFLSYQGGGATPRHVNAHNNTILDTGVSPSGTACGIGVETGAGIAGTYQYIQDNIFWQVSTTYGVGCGAGGNSSTVADLYETAGHNAFFNISGSHYRNSGSVYTNAPGTGDQTGDPQFVDPTRNFLKFCQSLDGTITTWDGCRAKFLARTSGFTPTALIDYVRAGFVPQASFIATMSTTGSYVGAVAPSVSTPTVSISGSTLKGVTIQ